MMNLLFIQFVGWVEGGFSALAAFPYPPKPNSLRSMLQSSRELSSCFPSRRNFFLYSRHLSAASDFIHPGCSRFAAECISLYAKTNAIYSCCQRNFCLLYTSDAADE